MSRGEKKLFGFFLKNTLWLSPGSIVPILFRRVIVYCSTPISCHFSLTVNPIRAAYTVSGAPGGSVKTAYSIRGSDYLWFVDKFKIFFITPVVLLSVAVLPKRGKSGYNYCRCPEFFTF